MLGIALVLTCLVHTGHGQWNGEPLPGEEATCVANHMRARIEDPTFKARMVNWNVQEAANRLAEDMEAVMADPKLQKEASRFAERTEAMMADPKVREEAMRIVETMAAKMADPVLHEEAKRIVANVEEMETMMQTHGPLKSLAMKFLAPGFTMAQSTRAEVNVPSVVAPQASRRDRVKEVRMAESGGFGKLFGGKKDAKKGEEEQTESKQMMQKVKDAGVAGIISYIFWEWAFWGVSIPVCISGYYGVTGHWPDFSNPDDQKQLAGEAFAFVNVARFAVPARIGLALGTTPWVKENVVDKFGLEKDK